MEPLHNRMPVMLATGDYQRLAPAHASHVPVDLLKPHDLGKASNYFSNTSVVLFPDPAKNLRMNCVGRLTIRVLERNASLPTCQMPRWRRVFPGSWEGYWSFASHRIILA